jgi:AcrR family transcriptional regulator
VRKTRAQLRQALTQLLEEQELRSITVQALTRRADINRGTFYAHYRDIYDLVEQTEKELFDEIEAMLDAYPSQRLRRGIAPILEDVFRFVGKNQSLCRVFVGRDRGEGFFQRLNQLIYQKCLGQWEGLFPLGDLSAPNYTLEFVVAGTVGLLRTWAARGFREPPEEMAALAERLILSGLGDPEA